LGFLGFPAADFWLLYLSSGFCTSGVAQKAERRKYTDRQTDRGELREVHRERVFFCVWHG
jgi:hypothetical protein